VHPEEAVVVVGPVFGPVGRGTAGEDRQTDQCGHNERGESVPPRSDTWGQTWI
jgi:hypothetical protein